MVHIKFTYLTGNNDLVNDFIKHVKYKFASLVLATFLLVASPCISYALFYACGPRSEIKLLSLGSF